MSHRPEATDGWGRELVDEAAALLAGGIVQVYLAADVPLPAWANLNWIAHGPPSEIVERAKSEAGLCRPAGSWAWVTSTFAHELDVGSGGDPDIVEQLQRDCLIPMELALMRPGHDNVLPEHAVVLGVPRLHAHPSVRSGT
jgi:hypothetical protein